MRLLLFGRDGQLGRELHRLLLPLGQVTALDFDDLDLCDAGVLHQRITAGHPHVILNAAAYTAVDRAESESGLAMQVNAAAPGVIAQAARELNAAFIHYSTDFVFDGGRGSPYTEQDTPNPINTYGRSKLAGEAAVLAAGGTALILRTSWLYSLHGDSFVSKMLALARRQETLKIVTDQVGSPTWARLLAQLTVLLLAAATPHPAAALREKTGIYHLAGAGAASRFEFAQAILAADPRRSEQLCTQLLPALTADFPAPAARPPFSALDCAKFESAFQLTLPPWDLALRLAMAG
jgi:dTDP-4-dehydrorhamnose reductase